MSLIETRKFGSISVTILTDGTGLFDESVFQNTNAEEIGQLLNSAGAEAIATHFNAVLIQSGKHNLLVDTGYGPSGGPTVGMLSSALAEAGVAANDITQVFITHLHGDHYGGALHPDNTAAFPNADLMLLKTEYDHWMKTDWKDAAGQGRQARMTPVFEAYKDRLSLLDDQAEIIVGVTVDALPGHTPGHAGLRVSDDGQEFYYATDIIHAQTLQLTNPAITVTYDTDPATAHATRIATLNKLATNQTCFSGGHIMSPKFAKVEKTGDGYALKSA